MEALIAKLLGDFEAGRMTRRQLIRSLAIAASAAEPAAAAERNGFQAVAVNHISYQVAHYGKTRDFYAGLLGMKVSHDDGRQCQLSFGNSILLPRNGHTGRTPRIDHVAYTIDTWDKASVEAGLKRHGLQPRPDTEDSFHVQDPDGFDLQICGKGMMKA